MPSASYCNYKISDEQVRIATSDRRSQSPSVPVTTSSPILPTSVTPTFQNADALNMLFGGITPVTQQLLYVQQFSRAMDAFRTQLLGSVPAGATAEVTDVVALKTEDSKSNSRAGSSSPTPTESSGAAATSTSPTNFADMNSLISDVKPKEESS